MQTKLNFRTGLIAALAFLAGFAAHGQQFGSIDISFSKSSLGGTVSALVVMPDDRIVIGGSFTAYEGRSVKHLVRVTQAGSLDSSFDPGLGPDASVSSIAIQNDGKIVIGGLFTKVNGRGLNRIARLNYDGTVDFRFNPGAGASAVVNTVAMQSDGKILVGGLFTNFNGHAMSGLVRLNPDGTVDTNFAIGRGFWSSGANVSPSPAVYAIQVQQDQKILVGGAFNTFDTVPCYTIIRLNSDGSRDSTFAPDVAWTGYSASVRAVAFQPDGKILIGGSLATARSPASNLARLHPDGTVDTNFISNLNTHEIYAVSVMCNSNILVGAYGLACLKPNGTKDNDYAPYQYSVYSLGIQRLGGLIIGAQSRFSRLLGPTPSLSMPAIIEQPADANILIGETAVMQVREAGYTSHFQWFRNGTPLPGVTSAVFPISDAQVTNSGSYTVRVSNSFEVVSSRTAVLNVAETAPVFLLQPNSTSLNAGSTLTLKAKSLGFPAYQWYMGTSPIAGKTNASLTIANVIPANAGEYYVVAANGLGVSTSQVASVTITEAAVSISVQPVSQSVAYGSTVSFSVKASGRPDPTYQWYLNGNAISGATRSSYTIPEAPLSGAGNYTVTASNYLNIVCSEAALLEVANPFQISGNWYTNVNNWSSGGNSPWTVQTNVAHDGGDALRSGSIGNSENSSVEAQVTGPGLISFWWKVSSQQAFDELQFFTNGVLSCEISGELDWRYVVVPLPAGIQNLKWRYSKNISSVSGQDGGWLDEVDFRQASAPQILLGPANQGVLPGGYTTLNIDVVGELPLSYQWQFNGLPISGATDPSLTLTNVHSEQTGSYSVQVSNNRGTTTSPNALLSLRSMPVSDSMRLLWKIAPGEVAWIPIEAQADTYRGLAYNPVSDHLLVVSRALGTNVYVLDSNTGHELHRLDTTGITGGSLALNMIAVAEDGAVYAGNLVEDVNVDPLKLYRWPDDSPSAVPSLVWQGNPQPGYVVYRWGDSLDVRGSGDSTQLMLGASPTVTGGERIALINPFWYPSFALKILYVTNIMSSQYAPFSVRFASGDAIWLASGGQLNYAKFNDFGAILEKRHSLSHSVNLVGTDATSQRLAVVSLDSPDTLRLFEVLSPTNTLLELDSEFFTHPTDYANNWGVGSVTFGGNRVFALNSGNGIMALQIMPTIRLEQTQYGPSLSWSGSYGLQSAPNVDGPWMDVQCEKSPYLIPPTSERLFFRLKD